MISVDWATLRLYAFSPSDQPKACNDRHCFSTSAPSISCASSILTIAVPRCMYNALITAVSTDSICSAAYIRISPFRLAAFANQQRVQFPFSLATVHKHDSWKMTAIWLVPRAVASRNPAHAQFPLATTKNKRSILSCERFTRRSSHDRVQCRQQYLGMTTLTAEARSMK